MVKVVSVKRPALGPIELSFIADRVVNCLSREGQIRPGCERSDIFAKAAQFLDIAAQGGEILKTRKLSVNASDELRNYGWTARAYAMLADRPNRPKPGDLVFRLKELRGLLTNLAKAETIDEDKVKEIRELFAFMRDIALTIDARPTDRITITSFSPKSLE